MITEFYGQATKAKEENIIGQEKEQVEIAYVSAAVNKLSHDVTYENLQNELDKSVGTTKTLVTPNGDGTLNVLFNDTEHNYNVNNGTVSKVEPLSAGLYDANKNLLADWNELVNNYGLDVQIDYTIITYKKKTTSLYYILKNKSKLSTGTILVIDESVKKIGKYALCSCTSLTSITIPDSVTSIGSSAFRSCTSLTSITIPDSVTSIGSSAFESCTSLPNIMIPNNIKVIEAGTFSFCSSLINLKIPNSVETIAGGNGNYSGAFSKCTNLKNIEMPNNLKFIGKFAFQGCTSLESIFIPDSVTTIQGHAFSECTSLSNIYIPISVTSMLDLDGGSSPLFEGCNLEIYCGASSVPDGWGDEWNLKKTYGTEYIEPKLGYTREQYEAELNS